MLGAGSLRSAGALPKSAEPVSKSREEEVTGQSNYAGSKDEAVMRIRYILAKPESFT